MNVTFMFFKGSLCVIWSQNGRLGRDYGASMAPNCRQVLMITLKRHYITHLPLLGRIISFIAVFLTGSYGVFGMFAVLLSSKNSFSVRETYPETFFLIRKPGPKNNLKVVLGRKRPRKMSNLRF